MKEVRIDLIGFKRNILNSYKDKLQDSCVYLFTNKITNEQYVGSTLNLKQRICGHIQSFHNNRNDTLLKKSVRLHGINNFTFTVIEFCINYREKEQYHICRIDPELNICKLVSNPILFTRERRDKLSKAKTSKVTPTELYEYLLINTKNDALKKFKTSYQTMAKKLAEIGSDMDKIDAIKAKNTDDKIIEIYKAGCSIRHIKKQLHTSFERISGLLESNGLDPKANRKYLAKERGRKVSNKLKGIKRSIETKNKISTLKKGNLTSDDNPNARAVIDLSTGTIYFTRQEYAKKHNVNIGTVNERIKSNNFPYIQNYNRYDK